MQMMNELEAADARIKELEAIVRSSENRLDAEDDAAETESLRAQNETLTDDLNTAKDRIYKLEREMKEKEMKCKEEAENAKASLREFNAVNRKMEELKRLYAKEKEANIKRGATTEAMESRYEAMQTELKDCMEQNLKLQEAMEDMGRQIDLAEDHLKEKDGEVDRLETELLTQKESAAIHADVVRQKDAEIDVKTKDLEDAMRIARERQEGLAVAKRRLGDDLTNARAKIEKLENLLKAEVDKTAAMASELSALRDSSRVGSLERQVNELKQELSDAHEKETSLHAKFEDVTKEYLELAEKHVELDRDHSKIVERAVEDALGNERRRTNELNALLKDRDEEIADCKRRVEKVESQKMALEEEILSAKEYMQENKDKGFETMYRDIGLLKTALKRSESETTALTNEYNDVKENLRRMIESNSRLKAKCGLPDDFRYDDLELDESVRKNVEKSKFVVRELKEQNRELEEERLRLLKKLMRQAEMHHNISTSAEGGSAFTGLSPNEQDLVMRYADNLRRGVEEKPLDNRSFELHEKWKTSEASVKALTKEKKTLEIRLESALREAGRLGRGQLREDNSESEEAKATREAVEAMRIEVESMKKGEAELRKSLLKELPELVRRSAQHFSESKSVGEDADAVVDIDESEIKQEVLRGQVRDLKDALLRSRRECDALRTRVRESGKPPLRPKNKKVNDVTVNDDDDADFSTSRAMDDANQDDGDVVTGMGLGDSMTSLPSQDARSRAESGEHDDTPMRRLSFSSAAPSTQTDDARDVSSDNKSERDAQADNKKTPHVHLKDEMNHVLENMKRSTMEEVVREWEAPLQPHSSKHKQDAWVIQMRRVHRHLLASLVLLSKRDKALEISEEHVQKLHAKIKDAAFERSVLYHQYVADIKQHQQEASRLRSTVEELKAKLNSASVKARRFEEIVGAESEDAKAGSENKTIHHVVRELSRENIKLELNRASLLRKLNLSDAACRAASDARKRADSSVIDMRKMYQKRILYLELWKRRSEFTIKAMIESITNVVPRDKFESVKRELERLRSSHAEAVIQMSAARSAMCSMAVLTRQVTRLAKGNGGKNEEVSIEEIDSLHEELSRLCTDIVDLKSTIDAEESSKSRAAADESKAEENKSLRAQVAQLREVLRKTEALAEENASRAEKYKGMSDIASTQSQAVSQMAASHEESIQDLRKMLHDKWSESDDDMIIGKLQQELFDTKASYQEFVRKHDTILANLRKKELEVRRLEQENDDKDQLLLGLERKHAKDLATLHTAIDEMTKEDRQGECGPDALEKLQGTNEKLSNVVKELNRVVREAEEARDVAEMNLMQRVTSDEAVLSARADIEAMLAIPNSGGDLKRETHERHQLRMSARRLLALNEELRDTRRSLLKLERNFAKVQKENAYLNSLRQDENERVDELELAVTEKEATLRRQRLEGLTTASKQNDGDARKTSAMLNRVIDMTTRRAQKEMDQTSSSYPVDELGNQNDRLRERVEKDLTEIQDLEDRAARAESEVRRQKDSLLRASERLAESQMRVDVLERQLKEEGLVPVTSSDIASDAMASAKKNTQREGRRYSDEESRRLQSAAQKTVASLQTVLQQKNRVIEKYRERIQEMGEMQKTDSLRMQQEIERLTERLYSENGHTIETLRKTLDDVRRQTDVPEHAKAEADVDAGLIRRVEEAEDLIREHRDIEVRLRSKLKEEKKLRQTLERKVIRLSDHIEELESELDEAHEETKKEREALRVSKKPVEKLTKQIETTRERHKMEMNDMRDALRKLKDQIVSTEVQHAEKLEEQRFQLEKEREQAEKESRIAIKELRARIETMRSRIDDSGPTETKRNDEDEGSRENLEDKSASQRSSAARQRLRKKLDAQRESYREQSKKMEKLRKRLEHVEAKFQASLSRETKLRDALKTVSSERRVDGDRPRDQRRRRRDDNNIDEHFEGGREDDVRKRLNNGDATLRRRVLDVDREDRDTDTSSLRQQVSVLEAQNAALRGAALEAARKSGVTNGPALLEAAEKAAQDAVGGRGRFSLQTWRAYKKLQRRVALLQRRLKERTKELEAYRVKSSSTVSDVDRLKAKHAVEMRSLQTKMIRIKDSYLKLRHEEDDDEKGELVKDLRIRLNDVESERLELREKYERAIHEQRTLRSRIEETERRVEEAEREADAERLERRRLTSETDSKERGDIKAESEHLREERMREALLNARDELEKMRSNDAESQQEKLDLQFSLEAARLETRQQKQRIEAMCKELERMRRERDFESEIRGDASSSSITLSSPKGTRRRKSSKTSENNLRERIIECQSRSKALESVIDRMKRAMMKQQSELKRKSDALDRHEATRHECQRLRKKLSKLKDRTPPAPPKVSPREQRQRAASGVAEMTRLRMKLKQSEKRWRSAQADLVSLRKDLKRSEDELALSKRRIASSSAPGSTSRTRIDALERSNTELENKLSAARQELVTLRVASANTERLATENSFLKKELGAFDSDFFEEIEDLKYRYASALEEIRELKGQTSK